MILQDAEIESCRIIVMIFKFAPHLPAYIPVHVASVFHKVLHFKH